MGMLFQRLTNTVLCGSKTSVGLQHIVTDSINVLKSGALESKIRQTLVKTNTNKLRRVVQ